MGSGQGRAVRQIAAGSGRPVSANAQFPRIQEIGANPPLTSLSRGDILLLSRRELALPAGEISNLVGSTMPENLISPQRIANPVELPSREERPDAKSHARG